MALAMIAKLYQVEATRDTFKEPEGFAAAKRAAITPILSDLHMWLERRAQQVPPTSLLGYAVGYAMAQWPKLIRHLDHPVLTPDTNACEGAIRPFVLCRKNWLFSGSPRGAEASAALFSIIETSKARRLFQKLPTARTEDQITALAPFRSIKP